eukprot:TRINITY_DN3570_c0_g1_i1.p1 TRINITY_DN3570_c0_g1~~TRINITY_DN3570_c0_g1_i1.p1  ORF type:complete len:1401 (+),score=364.16 TRINITY_DN3570_c0_g1_i1:228-4205(+)
MIAEGAFGQVSLATHKQTKKLYIVKEIKFALLSDEDSHQLLIRELIVLYHAKHQNLVHIFDSYLSVNLLHVVLEYCELGSISSLYTDKKIKFNEEQIVLICYSVLSGLSYLNQLGICHRDIKGANIFLTSEGVVKLGDFGTCAYVDPDFKRQTFCGTPYWMAPEVIKNVNSPTPYDHVADVWSIGITAIECAESDPPHADCDPMHVLYVIATSPSPSLSKPSHWSSDFVDFVNQCLEKDPFKRKCAKELLSHPLFQNVNMDALKKISYDSSRSSAAESGSVTMSNLISKKSDPFDSWDWVESLDTRTLLNVVKDGTSTWSDWSEDNDNDNDNEGDEENSEKANEGENKDESNKDEKNGDWSEWSWNEGQDADDEHSTSTSKSNEALDNRSSKPGMNTIMRAQAQSTERTENKKKIDSQTIGTILKTVSTSASNSNDSLKGKAQKQLHQINIRNQIKQIQKQQAANAEYSQRVQIQLQRDIHKILKHSQFSLRHKIAEIKENTSAKMAVKLTELVKSEERLLTNRNLDFLQFIDNPNIATNTPRLKFINKNIQPIDIYQGSGMSLSTASAQIVNSTRKSISMINLNPEIKADSSSGSHSTRGFFGMVDSDSASDVHSDSDVSHRNISTEDIPHHPVKSKSSPNKTSPKIPTKMISSGWKTPVASNNSSREDISGTTTDESLVQFLSEANVDKRAHSPLKFKRATESVSQPPSPTSESSAPKEKLDSKFFLPKVITTSVSNVQSISSRSRGGSSPPYLVTSSSSTSARPIPSADDIESSPDKSKDITDSSEAFSSPVTKKSKEVLIDSGGDGDGDGEEDVDKVKAYQKFVTLTEANSKRRRGLSATSPTTPRAQQASPSSSPVSTPSSSAPSTPAQSPLTPQRNISLIDLESSTTNPSPKEEKLSMNEKRFRFRMTKSTVNHGSTSLTSSSSSTQQIDESTLKSNSSPQSTKSQIKSRSISPGQPVRSQSSRPHSRSRSQNETQTKRSINHHSTDDLSSEPSNALESPKDSPQSTVKEKLTRNLHRTQLRKRSANLVSKDSNSSKTSSDSESDKKPTSNENLDSPELHNAGIKHSSSSKHFISLSSSTPSKRNKIKNKSSNQHLTSQSFPSSISSSSNNNNNNVSGNEVLQMNSSSSDKIPHYSSNDTISSDSLSASYSLSTLPSLPASPSTSMVRLPISSTEPLLPTIFASTENEVSEPVTEVQLSELSKTSPTNTTERSSDKKLKKPIRTSRRRRNSSYNSSGSSSPSPSSSPSTQKEGKQKRNNKEKIKHINLHHLLHHNYSNLPMLKERRDQNLKPTRNIHHRLNSNKPTVVWVMMEVVVIQK